MALVCPKCGAARGQTKSGLAHFCMECGYPFTASAGAASSTSNSLTGSEHPNADAGSPVVNREMSSSEGHKAPSLTGDVKAARDRSMSGVAARTLPLHEQLPNSYEPPTKFAKMKITSDDEAVSNDDGARNGARSTDALEPGLSAPNEQADGSGMGKDVYGVQEVEDQHTADTFRGAGGRATFTNDLEQDMYDQNLASGIEVYEIDLLDDELAAETSRGDGRREARSTGAGYHVANQMWSQDTRRHVGKKGGAAGPHLDPATGAEVQRRPPEFIPNKPPRSIDLEDLYVPTHLADYIERKKLLYARRNDAYGYRKDRFIRGHRQDPNFQGYGEDPFSHGHIEDSFLYTRIAQPKAGQRWARKRSSLPALDYAHRREVVDTSAEVSGELDEDSWSSDDEDYYTQKKDPEPTGMETSEKSEAGESERGESEEPMEQTRNAGDNAASADVEVKDSTAAGAKEETPPEADSVAEVDVLTVFTEYHTKMNSLRDLEKRNIAKLHKVATDKLAAYHDSSRPEGSSAAAGSSDQSKLTSHQQSALKGMRTFINTNSTKLNEIFKGAKIKMVAITKVPTENVKKRTARKLTFKIVLSRHFTEYFEGRGLTEPVVEIRCDTTEYRRPFTTLHRNEQGVWTGEWSAPLTLPAASMRYKYLVYDGMNHTKDNWEFIHRSPRGKEKVERCVDVGGSDADFTVYDGIVFPSRHSQIWKSFDSTHQLADHRSGRIEDAEYLLGIKSMLPDWSKQAQNKTSIYDICVCLEHVRSRQLGLLTAFDKDSYQMHGAKRMLDQAFGAHIGASISQHMTMLETAGDVWQIISSMIGLLHMATYQHDGRVTMIEQYSAQFIALIKATMEKAADLLTALKSQRSQKPTSPESLLNDWLGGGARFKSDLAKSLLAAALKIGKVTINDPTWIALIPFIHLLTGASSLEARVGDRNNSAWWGVEDFTKIMPSVQRFDYKSEHCKRWLGWLHPWFMMDRLLPYSFISLLSADQLAIVLHMQDGKVHSLPLDGVLAKVHKFVARGQRRPATVQIFKGLLQYVSAVAERSKPNKHCVQMARDFLHPLLTYSTIALKGLYEIVQIYLHLVYAHSTVKQEKPVDQNELVALNELIEPLVIFLQQLLEVLERSWQTHDINVDIHHRASSYTRSYRPTEISPDEVEVWKELFRCRADGFTLQNWWIPNLQFLFKHRLTKVSTNDPMVVVNLYCNQAFPIPAMDTALADVAFVKAEQVLLDKKKSTVFEGKMKTKIGRLVDQALTKTWDSRDESPMNIVRNMIKWGNFLPVWRFYESLTEDQKKSISSENRKRLNTSMSALERIYQNLLDRNITFADFVFIKANASKALDLCNVSQKLSVLRLRLEHAIEQRGTERQVFLEFHEQLGNMWQSCGPAVKERAAVDAWLQRKTDRLVFLETVRHVSGTLEVICPLAPPSIRALLEEFQLYRQRQVWREAFREYVGLAKLGPFADVENLYKQTTATYKKICDRLNTGKISIAKFEDYHERYFKSKVDIFLDELPHMIDHRVLEERQHQVRLSSEVDHCHRGAQTMLDMRELFHLTGDFSDMDHILESKDKKLELRHITDKLLESAGRVKDITSAQRKCLEEFKECSEFVEWAKKEVPKKDISNFVDLASSTLGEDDMAAQKTRYLLNALSGYAPLIYYDFEQHTTSFEDFLGLCHEVWEVLTVNPKLQENLRNTASELEWLTKVKTHFGSVEIDTITQATAINQSGVYRVGNIHNFSSHFKTLEDVLVLKCQVEEKVEGGSDRVTKEKMYKHSELKDLQSKLTLVAGDKQKQNKDTIRRFDEMRDAVENLAKAYLDIRREGCIQFDDLLIKINCGPDELTAVSFKLQSIKKQFNGKRSIGLTVLDYCRDLYAYMTDCVRKWRQNMTDKRSGHPELNFYSTEQLVVLRKELGGFMTELKPETLQQSLPLLAMIHPISPSDLHQLITSYQPPLPEGEQFDVEAEYAKLNQDQQDLVYELMEEHSDLPKDLTVEAVSRFDYDEAEKYVQWIKEQQASRGPEIGKGDLLSAAEILKDLVGNLPSGAGSLTRRVSHLIQQLESLWEGFVQQTDRTIRNFLSIAHLGSVLNKLREFVVVPKTPRRIPFWLERARPHLIAVSRRNTYQMVLSIYEFDVESPFPTRNEVLICRKTTSCDEVMLFLNRALGDSISFYCMVNCHLLDYDVCREIESRISRACEEKAVNYGLAFIYAEDVRDARIRAHLDKFLLKNPEIAPSERLASYVQEILSPPEDMNMTKIACSADPHRSMARLLRSSRAGVGKSLQKSNICNRLRHEQGVPGRDITIPVYKTIDTDSIIARLTAELENGYTKQPCSSIHIDIAHEVEEGVDELLFNLIVLRSIVNSEGVVWQAQSTQYYIIECMPFTRKDRTCAHEVLDLLPTIMCITPEEAYRKYLQNDVPDDSFIGFDEDALIQTEWQTVLKYLVCFMNGDKTYTVSEDDFTSPSDALRLLIDNCGLRDPTWSELRHYVYFLSNQLFKVDRSPFCGQESSEDLPGFRQFVVEFMFRMAKDFATRSLKIAEETPGVTLDEVDDEEDDDGGRLLDQLAMKRTWESGNHPYLFFNEDGATLTPLGFFVHNVSIARPFSLVDCETQEILLKECITRELKRALDQCEMSLSENFKTMRRSDQLKKLRDVMVKHCQLYRQIKRPDGSVVTNQEPYFLVTDDPDPNYVLTMDNAKKILAIHQRLRVDIPVIIMGETGCGKTKLIEFMSKLQVPTALKTKITTMVTVKIHGGTSEQDIVNKVEEAVKLAKQNQAACQQYAAGFDSEQVPAVYTILFLDEANTTEAIGLVKEILCDHRMRGVPLDPNTQLKIIAACNPYRRHSPDMIEKLKKAGLGYSVSEAETKDKFGQIPMRHLVYRVQALSQSLLPLVWDFGTLRALPDPETGEPRPGDVESSYIAKMAVKSNSENRASGPDGLDFTYMTARVVKILSATQAFMREQKDECSFVSLRDIQRLLDVADWFYGQRLHIFPAMDELEEKKLVTPDEDEEMEEEAVATDAAALLERVRNNYPMRCLFLALGVCYLARLEEATRKKYAAFLKGQLEDLMGSRGHADGAEYLFQQIELCQDVFINEVVDENLHKNIAKNKALKENVFMMIVCIENRIPLFVVGKPGSSKSLSKSMVVDSMKGTSSRSELFKRMKRVYMVSFQCSRHATPEGIVAVFNHCANFQKAQDLSTFVSVVVLDEVGLAEDSENMPLKTLHPLLEDGCDGNKEPEPYMKCAFVGISNWALDPAKMNRGIFVQRGTPKDSELVEIASEINRTGERGEVNGEFIAQLARGYLDICAVQKPEERDLTEFFGLRDFYSLMKMVVNFASYYAPIPLTRNQMEHSIKRNFGGFDPDTFDPMVVFRDHCPTLENLLESEDGRPPTDSIGLIKSSLSGEDTAFKGMESRYLLILTENLSVLSIILDEFKSHDQQPEVVFGSRFRDDVSYTQMCQNIYRIKTCMDMGKPVILLNLDDLYESLYDALNQYFSTWGDKKFVDLGLGTHRVKAFVDDNFRLVVIADKNKVHSQFPIPLINRLEKHYVSATSLLTDRQKLVKGRLESWAEEFARPLRHLQLNTCPLICDGCEAPLDQPYKLECLRHYIGSCCKEAIFNESMRRVCPVDQTEISAEYEWAIDKAALENRQYSENTTTATVFIGYSSEMTALAVRQATEDVSPPSMDTEDSEREYRTQVLERAKFHLLQCCTGESVLRLDKMALQHEAKRIQQVYMHEQHHENLHQYLSHQLSSGPGTHHSLFIQVTSFAELMVAKDIEALSAHLEASHHPTAINCLFLKDFVKEDQFTENVRSFYEKRGTGCKLLIVQCETANENTELLDSVRYIIQRESEIAGTQTHTVLLLNLPRGHTFTGYQGGKWQCVHIDDPRSPEIRLPSLSKCMQLNPSQILEKVIQQRARQPHVDRMDDADDDGDVIMNVDLSPHDDDSSVDDMLPFIINCLPVAVSVIRTEQQYGRVALLKRLFETNPDFLQTFLAHAHSLLKAQAEFESTHWVKSDAAKASNMKQSETLRHALEDSLERAFVPALAAVISFVDVRENLQILETRSPLRDLWMQIFNECEKLGLTFEQLSASSSTPRSKLPRYYRIVDVGDGHQQFGAQFPFSWLVKSTIDKLMQAVRQAGDSLDVFKDSLIEQFEMSPIGRVITAGCNQRHYNMMMDSYLVDFVYMSYPCCNTTEHEIAGHAINVHLRHMLGPSQRMSMVHIHLAYASMEQTMRNLSAVFNLIVQHGDSLVRQALRDTATADAVYRLCDLVALTSLLTLIKEVRVHEIQADPERWVSMVEQCKPVALQVLETSVPSDAISECRDLWTLLELKKLYVEHVIVPSPIDQKRKRRGYKLVNLVKNVIITNFQTMAGFDQVVQSLQETVKEGIRSLYPGCPSRCPVCHHTLDAPVRLPCEHILCEDCVQKLEFCNQENCGRNIAHSSRFDPASTSKKLKAEFESLRTRLDKFFMHFVSELVFSSEPEPAILTWLVDRVTLGTGTRHFNLFSSEDVVGSSLMLRLFLLKLLLKCEQSENVHQYLNQIISSWTANSAKNQIQTMVLLMDCHKDLNDSQLNVTELAEALGEHIYTITRRERQPTVELLMRLADLQCVLNQSVDVLTSKAVCDTAAERNLEKRIKAFLEQAKAVGNPQPGYLVTRQLLNKDGESFLKDLLNTRHNFLVPADIKQNLDSFTVPDALSVYGGQLYTAAKEALDVVIGYDGGHPHLTAAVKDFKKVCDGDHYLLVQVLFTRITCTFVQRTPVNQAVRDALKENLRQGLVPDMKALLEMLLRDGGLPREMDVNQSKGINLTMLILHLYSSLRGGTAKADLNPLSEIVSHPSVAGGHFLPTMADNQYEIHQESIRQAMQTDRENPVAYRCPNGHPYVIGDCGRPYYTANCHECGAQIGGQGHTAAAGNQALGDNDAAAQSRKGHILGRQTSRSGAAPERELSAISCAVLRCLTHTSMFTSSLFHPAQVLDLIQPRLVRQDDVQPFLEAHILLDLQQIANCCAESTDDSILLVHDVIHRMNTDPHRGTDVILDAIDKRKLWEKGFDEKYIKPVFNRKRESLQRIRAQLTTANSEDLRLAVSTANKSIDRENVLGTAGLWGYRRPLTVPAIQNMLNSMVKDCDYLPRMADNYDRLQAVRYLPDVLALLNILNNKFHSRFSRAQAAQLRIGDFCRRNQAEISNISALAESFIESWNLMIKSNSQGAVVSVAELCMDSPLTELLYDQHASRRGGQQHSQGSAPFQLVSFLVESHNKMLSYDDEDSIPSIPLVSVNSSNIVCVVDKQELIDLVLAHSEYELRETTAITYNWPAIEREVLHRYISNKPRIIFTKDQLPCYVYQEDFNLHNQMEAIDSNQEMLSQEAQDSVINLLPARVPMLSSYLRELKVVINFLSVRSHIERDNSLTEYMETTFGNEPAYLSKGIKLKHIKHVWLLVKFTQTELLMRQHQEPFDDLSPEYRAGLPQILLPYLNEFRYNSPRTKNLVHLLFQYITLRLNKAAIAQEPIEPAKSLHEALQQEIIRNGGDDDMKIVQRQQELPDLPDEAKVKHASKVWCYLWTRFTTPLG